MCVRAHTHTLPGQPDGAGSFLWFSLGTKCTRPHFKVDSSGLPCHSKSGDALLPMEHMSHPVKGRGKRLLINIEEVVSVCTRACHSEVASNGHL